MADYLYEAALLLLEDGGYIEQIAETPITYRIVYQGDSAPVSGGIVRRLQTSQKVRESSSRINGKKRLYLVNPKSS